MAKKYPPFIDRPRVAQVVRLLAHIEGAPGFAAQSEQVRAAVLGAVADKALDQGTIESEDTPA